MSLFFRLILLLPLFGILIYTQGYTQRKNLSTAKHERENRQLWLQEMDKMARPVLFNLAQDSLRITMPQITSKRIDNKEQRIQVQYLEVVGRVLSGMAPGCNWKAAVPRK